MTDDWTFHRKNEINERWTVPTPAKGLMKCERLLGTRANPYRVCGFCESADARNKCNKCLLTYYCNKECQRSHWLQHKVDCTEHASTVEEQVAIAVIDYSCFWVYQGALLKHSLEGQRGICILCASNFIEQYGEDENKRTCMELALHGRQALILMKAYGSSQ